MAVEASPLPKLESRFRRFLGELDRCEGFVPGHSVAVCKSALRVAEELGVAADELPSVTLGALMHDIGKVFVDGRLLGNPAPLSTAELETVRLHPQLGEALLAPTARAYREPRSLDDALDELRRLSGRQFDPICVEALVDTVRQPERRRAVA